MELTDAELAAQRFALEEEHQRRTQERFRQEQEAKDAEALRPKKLVGMRVRDLSPGQKVWYRSYTVRPNGELVVDDGYSLNGNTIVQVETEL